MANPPNDRIYDLLNNVAFGKINGFGLPPAGKVVQEKPKISLEEHGVADLIERIKFQEGYGFENQKSYFE